MAWLVVVQLGWPEAPELETSFAELGGMLLHFDGPCWRGGSLCLTSLMGLLMELLLSQHHHVLHCLEE
jgi:hypothetical protein